jgi:hypothetical protein
MKTHKALIMDYYKDVDLIIEDGGYAFIYTFEGGVNLNLYQGRIERALNTNDTIDEIALESNDNTYYQTFNESNITDDIINIAIKWLCVGMDLKDFEITRIDATKVDYNKTINEFLNL